MCDCSSMYTITQFYLTLCLSADRWRVVLKGEQPDYIHAVNINVSLKLYNLVGTYPLGGSFNLICSICTYIHVQHLVLCTMPTTSDGKSL